MESSSFKISINVSSYLSQRNFILLIRRNLINWSKTKFPDTYTYMFIISLKLYAYSRIIIQKVYPDDFRPRGALEG